MKKVVILNAGAYYMSADTADEDWDERCSCCTMSKYCHCGLKAVQFESNENYHRRCSRCPKIESIRIERPASIAPYF